MPKREFNVAVVGATGAVGNQMIACLEERDFPIKNLILLASSRSEGKELEFRGRGIPVQVLSPESFRGIDIALFSAGASVSKEYGPMAVQAGAVVVDNSSAFRMDPDIPLVVPEVNPGRIQDHRGIIANPNCSTIQMVVVLKPLHDRAVIKRVVVSTYQAVSGTGHKAVVELREQTRALMNGARYEPKVYPYQIAFNVLPHIDAFLDNGYTKEEMKMVNETRKIMEDDSLRITATTVRVPVFYGHSESVNIETQRPIAPEEARDILSRAPGVRVVDDVSRLEYPLALDAAGQDETLVGRIRQDFSVDHGLALWIVADNVRKGAATNAVQIAEIVGRHLAG